MPELHSALLQAQALLDKLPDGSATPEERRELDALLAQLCARVGVPGDREDKDLPG